jgi:hypothetical protein
LGGTKLKGNYIWRGEGTWTKKVENHWSKQCRTRICECNLPAFLISSDITSKFNIVGILYSHTYTSALWEINYRTSALKTVRSVARVCTAHASGWKGTGCIDRKGPWRCGKGILRLTTHTGSLVSLPAAVSHVQKHLSGLNLIGCYTDTNQTKT